MSEANIPAHRPNAANHARRSISGAILSLAGAVIMASGWEAAQVLGAIVAGIGFASWVWHTYHRD